MISRERLPKRNDLATEIPDREHRLVGRLVEDERQPPLRRVADEQDGYVAHAARPNFSGLAPLALESAGPEPWRTRS
jgi:hypothetical protein